MKKNCIFVTSFCEYRYEKIQPDCANDGALLHVVFRHT